MKYVNVSHSVQSSKHKFNQVQSYFCTFFPSIFSLLGWFWFLLYIIYKVLVNYFPTSLNSGSFMIYINDKIKHELYMNHLWKSHAPSMNEAFKNFRFILRFIQVSNSNNSLSYPNYTRKISFPRHLHVYKKLSQTTNLFFPFMSLYLKSHWLYVNPTDIFYIKIDPSQCPTAFNCCRSRLILPLHNILFIFLVRLICNLSFMSMTKIFIFIISKGQYYTLSFKSLPPDIIKLR